MLIKAVGLLQAGRLAEARDAYHRVLTYEPGHILTLHHLGIVEHQLGNSAEGLRHLGECLRRKPDYAQAHSDLAVILMQLGHDDEAIKACRKAIALNPGLAMAHSNLGDLMQRRGDSTAAESAYGRAVAVQPDFAAAHAGRADALVTLNRLNEARTACENALRLAPALPFAHGAKGFLLHKEHKLDEAATAYREALRLAPSLALIHTRLGNVLRDQGRLDEALTANRNALEADPACADAHCNMALVLQFLGRYQEAAQAFHKALSLRPDFPDALSSLGLLLQRLGDKEAALTMLRKAVALAPDAGFTYVNLGSVLKDQGRLAEALENYRAMFRYCNPPPAEGLYDFCALRRHICDWNGLDEAEREALDALKRSGERMPPFSALAMACSPQDHLDLARIWAGGFNRSEAPQKRIAQRRMPGHRIRLGYLSADFFEHATASLITELIERHDRDRFEVFAYCYSPDEPSAMRQRLIAAFDRFRIIDALSHRDAARQIADDGIDILIDLKGYTRNARTAIMAERPAPVQVNYLGYPSTMGAPFIDYIIADRIVAPMAHQRFFDEKIVQLPDCYQPNDRQRQTEGAALSRADCGLPADGFVFCSFNNAYKITAPIFAVWMRLLKQVPGSVLWLLDSSAADNLRREAAEQGVDPQRLVFAPRVTIGEHLRRYALADLFLDNLPVNAHTTASEALWSGLPLVTCPGEIFVGRVAASLLSASGCPELIANSLEEYEALALHLARTPAELAHLRQKLTEARRTGPLFDSDRYARNLEAAFAHMMELHDAGSAPMAFDVGEIRQFRAEK